MHLWKINNDLWHVVENGIPSITPSINATDVKRFKQLDSQAKNIICGHLSKGQYGRVSALESAKLIWDRLSKVNEGVSTQRDSRVDVLCNLFNRFKRLDNENIQQTFDRLTDISNELQALGATDITDHVVVKKLLRSLDSSFDTPALMIQEHGDYKSLDPADILESLILMSSNLLRRETPTGKPMENHAHWRQRQFLNPKEKILKAVLVILKN